MVRRCWLLLVVLMLAGVPLAARGGGPAPGPLKVESRYWFDGTEPPSREKCRRVGRSRARRLRRAYVCAAQEITNTASGQPAISCRAKMGRGELLLFRSRSACEEERETQGANAP